MQPYINIIGFIANHIDTASTNTTGYKNTCLQENAMSSFVSRCVFLPSPVHTLLHVYRVLLQSHVNTCIHPLFATISPYHPLQDPVIACTGPCHPLYSRYRFAAMLRCPRARIRLKTFVLRCHVTCVSFYCILSE